ncbi:MAG TPA: Ig-like domain-containing protein, partial [Thermoleophilaceae bacterium]
CGPGTLADAPGLDGANGVAVSPSGSSVYVAASDDDAVVQLDREVPPVCHGTAAASPAGAAVTVPLECSDPNGDQLEISIDSEPAHGSLGAIDQVDGSVVYTPDAGFAGSDYFSISAIADGKRSELATVVIQVGTSGAPGPPGAPGAVGPPGPVSERLLALLADDRFRVRSGRSLRVRFAVSAAAGVQLDLRKGSRRLATAERSLRSAGVGVLKLYARRSGSRRGRRLAPGNYLLRLTGTGADGQRATDSARLRITR